MLTGSTAAILLGLLFVAVSLHIDILSKARKSSDVRMFALQAFENFMIIIGFAFIVPMGVLGYGNFPFSLGFSVDVADGRVVEDL
jgi:hypothetical protein